MIINAILKLTWMIFIQGPLSLINAFNTVLEYLTGGIINDILFGSSTKFNLNNIPMQFWWFVILAFCLFSLIFTIQMIILLFKEAIETKTKFVLAIQNAVKAFIFIFLIPIFFFLANFIVQNIAYTVINNFGGQNSSIAKYLWHIGDPTWSPSSGDISAPDDFGPPNNIRSYHLITQLFGTWFMLFAILAIGVILIQKLIELFFLFVISPIIMIVMVIDGGKAAFSWKDMVIAKFLASTGTLIGYYIFMAVTQILLSSGLKSFTGSNIARSLFIILFLFGGALATMSFSDIIASFLGEAVGIKEGMASMKSTMVGGMMALGAGKMVSRAMGFAKSKRAGRFPGLAGAAMNKFTSGASGEEEQASERSGLNFSTFKYASSGLASRSGIMGLAGLALGAAAVGYANFKSAKKVGGTKAGLKNFGRGIGKAAVSPAVRAVKAINPGVYKFTKEKVIIDQAKLANKKTKQTNNKKQNKRSIK